jgi:8-oxo-dGTP pyrophosphatase MutT (NUDIX family)
MCQARQPPSEPPSEVVVARDAATVLLTHDGPAGAEVLLLERHASSRMAPGAFAFPGGRVEEADSPPDAERLCQGLTRRAAAARLVDVTPPERAIGFWIAALREVFEETGLLVAYDADGAPARLPPDRLADARRRCRLDSATFRSLLLDDGLRLATDRMAYWAHWITPEERPVRYDTRFFVAASLGVGVADPDNVEVVGSRWLTPADALAHHADGRLVIPRVTQEILRSVMPYPTVDALLAGAASREIRPIRARILLVGGQEQILMPDDPGWF